METPFSSTAPTKFYAFLLKLRPLRPGTLMPFSGELIHGAWLNWLKNAAPDVAAWLHDGNRRRFFTCSNLQWPLSPQRVLEVQRMNIHMPLDPEKTYSVRVTLLLSELFPLFQDALLRFNPEVGETRRPPFMQIGKQLFMLEEVQIGQNDTTGWTGFTSLNALLDKVKATGMTRNHPLTLEFASLTTFNRNPAKGYDYGNHYARMPLPQYVFPNLVRRWQDIAPPEMQEYVQLERVEAYAANDGVIIADYDLKTHQMHFTTHVQPGFLGKCVYQLRGTDEAVTAERPLTLRQQLLLLGHLAFYCGVGYKTSMGMGQTRLIA